ncbi:hypothetical protein ACQEUV_05625 [Micromonospora aurantiaca (nom. illeg.)]|uniref:hypothetical protein n=1 Tax=Micromonospora aurantiaca (nom. illeg.) TaxID=47850 RepID=UPI003DA3E2E0
MKVFPVVLDSGQTASLRFDDTKVWITSAATRWRQLLRWSAGAVLVGLGLAAIANGVGHAVNPTVGLWSSAATVALVVAGGLAAAAAGIGLRRAERRPTGAIGVADIAAARSEQAGGRIIVTVTHVDGSTHRFSGTGMAGARTAQLFARLLSPAAPPRDTAPPSAAATVAGGADTTV